MNDKMSEELNSMSNSILELATKMEKENEKFVMKGNKQAGRRARVLSLEITELNKKYRKVSMEAVKSM